MHVAIGDVISEASVGALRQALKADDLWEDGAVTAGGRAKSVKNNQQLKPDHPSAKGVFAKINKALKASDVFNAAAQPSSISRLIVNRFTHGMAYGSHVDAAYISGERTDLSFTLFLSDPASYEGGELVIDLAGSESRIKLPAGSLYLYPSSTLHEVAPVSRGERLAAVGWVRSRVRAEEDRDLVFALEQLRADLVTLNLPGDLIDRANNLRNNLLRRFGD